MKNNFNLLTLGYILLAQIWVTNYKFVVITAESVEAAKQWEDDQEIAVKLETVSGNTIGLSHWSPGLADTNIPFFFEPSEVDTVFSCYPEFLPEEIRKKHLFPNSSGINYQGRIGQVVIFSQGVFNYD